MPSFPEPTDGFPSPTEVLLGYLDFFRERAVAKIAGLPDGEATRSRLPSGWTPLELLAHRLDAPGAPGPRWRGAEPATLERVLLHLVQEWARHLGQIDVVAELAGGETGE